MSGIPLYEQRLWPRIAASFHGNPKYCKKNTYVDVVGKVGTVVTGFCCNLIIAECRPCRGMQGVRRCSETQHAGIGAETRGTMINHLYLCNYCTFRNKSRTSYFPIIVLLGGTWHSGRWRV